MSERTEGDTSINWEFKALVEFKKALSWSFPDLSPWHFVS
jgi:hypothetical protein